MVFVVSYLQDIKEKTFIVAMWLANVEQMNRQHTNHMDLVPGWMIALCKGENDNFRSRICRYLKARGGCLDSY